MEGVFIPLLTGLICRVILLTLLMLAMPLEFTIALALNSEEDGQNSLD